MEKVDARPEKGFFIRMLTKDIELRDCLLDLLDNCLDGARRTIKKKGSVTNGRYSSFRAEITINKEELRIKDNCGGIPTDIAENYAFHFGRNPDYQSMEDSSIGLYGIGMKRAIFKMGRQIKIISSPQDENAFEVLIDVEKWESRSDWDFPAKDIQKLGTSQERR
jgi:hypothetical protein